MGNRSSSSHKKGKRSATRSDAVSADAWLRIGRLRVEKCDLQEAREAYLKALAAARLEKNSEHTVEAIVGLLRLSGEALDDAETQRWESELDALISRSSRAAKPRADVPPLAWYSKGAVALYREDWTRAQRYFHRFVHAARKLPESRKAERTEHEARGLAMLANVLLKRGRVARARWLCEEILRRHEADRVRAVNGSVYLMLAAVCERGSDLRGAFAWVQKAHASYLEEHNWYHYLYVLYRYARIARQQKNYAQSYWYLDLVDKAARGPGFALIRREVAREKSRLEDDAVDLLIDGRKGLVRTRDGGQVSLRKQYVLLDILRALSRAHGRSGEDAERGLSKAEIIEQVWKESYRPEAHDNKLYYNINRLRKLIEPDVRQPQYLLNWKEGYRLAPGIRVEYVGGADPGGAARGAKAPRH